MPRQAAHGTAPDRCDRRGAQDRAARQPHADGMKLRAAAASAVPGRRGVPAATDGPIRGNSGARSPVIERSAGSTPGFAADLRIRLSIYKLTHSFLIGKCIGFAAMLSRCSINGNGLTVVWTARIVAPSGEKWVKVGSISREIDVPERPG